MSMIAEFYAAVSPALDGRLYYLVAESGTRAPYAVYTDAVTTEQNTLDANGGKDNLQNTRMQIDIWADSPDEAKSKASAVKAAMKDWATANTKIVEEPSIEDSPRLYGVTLEYSIWHR